MFFFFHENIAYLKGNSKIKEKFFQENSYTEIRKTYFLAPKLGVDLYTGKYGTKLCWEILIFNIFFVWCPFTQHVSHILATPTLDVDIQITNQNIEKARHTFLD